MFYYLIRKLLFLIDPEKAHTLTLKYLNSKKIQLLTKFFIKPVTSEKKIKCMGLTFNNKLGAAAGIDKNGEYINTLSKMGFSFIEVGTVTPLPQYGNPKPRLFRITPAEGIVNRMGFNNLGIDNLIENIKKSDFKGIIGVNIGKNKNTDIKNAINDYLICMEKVYLYANYIAVNISSPNTTDLRKLQYGILFEKILHSIKKNKKKCIKNILNTPLWQLKYRQIFQKKN